MKLKPFPDQQDLLNDINQSWHNGNRNVLAVAATGFGKTLIKAFVADQFSSADRFVVIFAHRDVLLSQISMSLCDVGLPHKFICSRSTEREISDLQVQEYGHSFNDTNAKIIVASVLTWVKRDVSHIAQHISLWMIDEGHHTSPDNSWGKCIEPLVNSFGLAVTATPLRADKKPLGRKHGGVFDDMVKAIGMGELIARGRLSPYRIYTVPSSLDLAGVNVTSSGDYNQKKLSAATDKADITGDAVEHYLKLAAGQQAITFCVSIEHANHVAEQFNSAGVNSFVLSSKTPLAIRQKKESDFKNGLITNLINVDLFGEGYNVPKCSVVIMLRKTKSYGLFKQQFGRMLRLAEGKQYGILIDHVGNVHEHCIYGAPHDDPEWTLDSDKKSSSGDGEKGLLTRTCPECFGFYIPKSPHPKHMVCPYCDHTETDEQRNQQQREIQVREGTLVEFDSGYINQIIKEREKIDTPVEKVRDKMVYANAPAIAINSAVKRHLARQQAQEKLRNAVIEWCSEISEAHGYDVLTTQGEFNRVFNVDIFKAQTLSERESLNLLDKVVNHGKNEREIA